MKRNQKLEPDADARPMDQVKEVPRVLAQMQASHALMARLLYGRGLRLMACFRLRIKEIEFDKSNKTKDRIP